MSATGRRIGGRALTVMIVAATSIVLSAGPAAADPAGPTNYRSIITSVEPASDGVVFEIVGGDSFLVVTADPGHEVLVPGYFGEPYVRIDRDGSVWINEGSPAHYINEDRYGQADTPDWVDGEGEPQWVRVGSDGSYPWHDHRIHWMSRDLPPAITGDARQTVFPWELTVVVDGTQTTIAGDLVWIPSRSVLPALLAGVIALLPLTMWRRGELRLPAALSLVAAAVAIVITVAQNNGTPPEARGVPIWILFPTVALIAASAALLRRIGPGATVRLSIIAAVFLVAWAVATFEVLSLPVLIATIPDWMERAGVAFVLWAGAGVAVTSLLSLLASPAPQRVEQPA